VAQHLRDQRLFHPPPGGCPIGRSSHKLRSQRLLMWAGRPRPAMIASRLPQPSGFRSPSSGLTIIQVSALRSYLPTQVSGLKFPLSDSPPFLSSHHSALASSGFKSQPSGLQYFSSQLSALRFQVSGFSTQVSPRFEPCSTAVQSRFVSVASSSKTRRGKARSQSEATLTDVSSISPFTRSTLRSPFSSPACTSYVFSSPDCLA